MKNCRLVIAHLGNGASITAVKNGQSQDTSMGFTPLEGLVMGTRSGDVDAGIYPFLANNAGMSVEEVNDLLNKNPAFWAFPNSPTTAASWKKPPPKATKARNWRWK